MSQITEWQMALAEEVQHLKSQGSFGYIIMNGTFLYEDRGGAVYVFDMLAEVFFPPETPVRVVVGDRQLDGEVIAVEGFEIEIKLARYIGAEIREARLFSEPWQLLEELSSRLDEIKDDQKKMKRVAQVMQGNAPVRHRDKIKKREQELIYRAYYNATTYVWGPPGTGKTYHLSRVVAQHVLQGKRVLVTAHSNAAVDVLMLGVANVLTERGRWKDGEVVRYGYSRDEELLAHPSLLASKRVAQHLQDEREMLEERRKDVRTSRITAHESKELRIAEKKLRNEIKEQEMEQTKRALVVGATLSKCAVDATLYGDTYDLVVVDEVSMAYVPQVAFAASLGKRIVVCGDFKQLPPIATARHALVDRWLRQDIFHHAGITNLEHPHLHMLRAQRRMHPDISSFTNAFMYNNEVYDHPSVVEREQIAQLAPFPHVATMLVDVAKTGAYALVQSEGYSRYNILSGLMSVHLALQYRKQGVTVGIITPYKAHARFLLSCLREMGMEKKITVATVHRFQGSERDVIIFDMVDGDAQEKLGLLLRNKDSNRLMNVAVTRARGKFIQLANIPFVQSHTAKHLAVSALVEHMQKQEHVTTPDSFLQELSSKRLRWFFEESLHLYKDIRAAKKRIIVSAPHGISPRLRKELKHANATVIAYAPQPIGPFRRVDCNLVATFLMIDDTILWIGGRVKARLRAPETITLLKGYFGIGKKTT